MRESLYVSSGSLTKALIASSKACFARWHARIGLAHTSRKYTAKFSARPRRVGCHGSSVPSACLYAVLYASRDRVPYRSRSLTGANSYR